MLLLAIYDSVFFYDKRPLCYNIFEFQVAYYLLYGEQLSFILFKTDIQIYMTCIRKLYSQLEPNA